MRSRITILVAIIISLFITPSIIAETWVVWYFTLENNTDENLQIEFETETERITINNINITYHEEPYWLYEYDTITVELAYDLENNYGQIQFDDVIVCAESSRYSFGCKTAYANRYSGQTITFSISDVEEEEEDQIDPEPDQPEPPDEEEPPIEEDHPHDDNSDEGGASGCFIDKLLL